MRNILMCTFVVALVVAAGRVHAGTITLYDPVAGISGAPVDTVQGDFPAAQWSGSSWQAGGTSKSLVYLDTVTLFGRSDVTIGELKSISYSTKIGTTHVLDPGDWYIHIYTKPYTGSPGSSWYGNRLNAEPYFSENLTETPGEWTKWQTDAGENNRLRFFDSSSGYFGGYTDGFLQDLIADPNFTDQEILSFAVATGSGWASGFTGQIDGLTFELSDESVCNVNFEALPIPIAGCFFLLASGCIALSGLRRRNC